MNTTPEINISAELIEKCFGKKAHPSQVFYVVDEDKKMVHLKYRRKGKYYYATVPYTND